MQKILPRSRSSSRKSIQNELNQLTLEKVYGFTIQSNAAVALDPTSGIVAFPAGCVVVGYSAKRSKQFFIHNPAKSPITAIAFSKDGKYLATGESGKAPKVRIWNVETQTQLFDFSGHSYRVGALAFSHNARFVVSVGSQEDTSINVWELSSGTKLASSKVTSKVIAIAFSETGQFFVTVGVRHVRFWYLDSSRSKSKTTLPLSGRSAILGDFMNNTFTDVGCCCLNSGSGSGQMTGSMCSSFTSSTNQSYTYVISQAGQLMQFTEQRYLDKWVELRTPKATCLTVYESCTMVGCSRGIVLIFDTNSLSHIATLPMPHYLGINLQNPTFHESNTDSVRYPDVVAGKYDHVHSRITCFYSDHSIYVWDVRDFRKPAKVVSHLYHSGGIWSVEPISVLKKDDKGLLDVTSFITCSDDDTIRFWHLDEPHQSSQQAKSDRVPSQWENDFTKDLIKIIYTDPNLKSLIESDRNSARNKQQNNEAAVHLKHGIRSVKVSPDRQHLAAATREGNIKLYSLPDCKEMYALMAHNGEILCIDYFQSPSVPDLVLFCSASRDRVIHIMDAGQNYKCIQTIDDHSGAIFAAKLVETPNDQEIRLISCGMDKSLLFRILQPDESGQTAQFFLNQHLVGKQSQYDMVIAPNNRYAAVVCQDRQVRIYNMVTGKQRKSYRGATSDDGYLLKCAIDPSGTYLATSGSDKYISILNFATGELLASVSGHSEVAVGLCFLDDLKHLISVSADSCVFVWRLPVEMTLAMHRRIQDIGCGNTSYINENEICKDTAPPSTTGTVTPPRISDEVNVDSPNTTLVNALSNSQLQGDGNSSENGPAFRFSVSALPSWAQKKVNMMNEFCGGGICTVPESSERSQDNTGSLQANDAVSRRLSFIATENVIRDDDSDNLEVEDDSEWFNAGNINKIDNQADIEAIIPRDSAIIDDEDDEEHREKTTKIFPVRSQSLEDEEAHKLHCGFVINKVTQHLSDCDELNIMSTSAPSAIATWFNTKVEGSSSDEPMSAGHLTDSDDHPNSCVFSNDSYHTGSNDNASVSSSGFRSSLTTNYLSKNSYDYDFVKMFPNQNSKYHHIVKRMKVRQRPSILEFPFKGDSGQETSVQKPSDGPLAAQKNIRPPSANPKSTLAKKALSEVNVNQANNVGKKSDAGMKKIPITETPASKGTSPFGQHTKHRSESRENKAETIKVKKSQNSHIPWRVGISKAISTSSVSSIGRVIEPKSRASADSPIIKPPDQKTALVKPTPKLSSRARWADPKRTRDARKTCPVYLKDFISINDRKSIKVDNTEQASGSTNSTITPSLNQDATTKEIVISSEKEIDTKEHKISLLPPVSKLCDQTKLVSPLGKGASFDLSARRSKEHVIDEIEEVFTLNSRVDSNTELFPSALEDMFRFLSDQSQSTTVPSQPEPTNIIRSVGGGGECVMDKPPEVTESPVEPVVDQWIEDLCRTHSVEFLSDVVLKILQKFLDNTDWKTESQKETARRLFPEIERMYRHLRTICEPSSLPDDRDLSAAIIRDIGERIVEEVKRRLSDSH